MALLLLVLLAYGSAAAQSTGAAAPAAADAGSKTDPHAESIVVPGYRMKAAPVPRTNKAPTYLPQTLGCSHALSPASCRTAIATPALQNDVGGQPATSQTLTTTGCQ